MSKRRPTIGGDAFDALLTPPKPAPSSKAPTSPSKREKKVKAPPAPSGGRSLKVTYNVPAEIVEETRNAVLSLMAPPVRLTLSALVESALRRELDRLRKVHHGGEPFTGPGNALPGGRPLK